MLQSDPLDDPAAEQTIPVKPHWGRLVFGMLAALVLIGLLAWIRITMARRAEEGVTFTVVSLTSKAKGEVSIDWTADLNDTRGTLIIGWTQSGKDNPVGTVRNGGGLLNSLWGGGQSGSTGTSWFGVSPGVFEPEVQKGTVIHLKPGERRTLGHWTGDKTASKAFVAFSSDR